MILTKDRAGNQIYIKDLYAYLYLNDKMQTRRLWTVKDGNLYVTKKPEHIFKKLNAYGFNLALIKSLRPDAKIVVKQYGGKTIDTTAEEILLKGQILSYLKDGFETQIFMQITNFNTN